MSDTEPDATFGTAEEGRFGKTSDADHIAASWVPVGANVSGSATIAAWMRRSSAAMGRLTFARMAINLRSVRFAKENHAKHEETVQSYGHLHGFRILHSGRAMDARYYREKEMLISITLRWKKWSLTLSVLF